MKKVLASITTVAIISASAGIAFAGDSKSGQTLYKKKCKACHTLTDKKKVGPGMKGVFGRESKMAGKLDEAGLTAWLKDPKAVNPKSKMAKLFKTKLKDNEIADLVAYMKTL
ncbi:MAG: c-type cytochrome [Deltaproteobacteria bacterium]|nr:c-type cytochrome [Deltaproteobacteria bacterium]